MVANTWAHGEAEAIGVAVVLCWVERGCRKILTTLSSLFFPQARTLSGGHVLCNHRLRFGSGHQHQRQRAAEHVQRRGNSFPHRQQRVRTLSPPAQAARRLLQTTTQIFGRKTSADTLE